jgi:hypothetical protein
VVPNAWGVWNMLYLRLRSRTRLSLGVFGALLVVILIPAGLALGSVFDTFTTQWQFALPMFPVGMAVYYLAWKYWVSYLNAEMGIG